MATLNYLTPALIYFYPFSLGAGQTTEIGITYVTGTQVLAYLSVDTTTAPNVPFTIQNTIVSSQDSGSENPQDTSYSITVTNDSPFPGEFGLMAWTVFA